MRKVNFKVRNIGSEKYLSYVLDDEIELDEELLDYLDDNKLPELIDIIYEEDDENDYLTYNVTGRATVGSLIAGGAKAEMVLGILLNAANGIIEMRDLGIPVVYVVLNKDFTYVNPVTYDVKMICIPVESDISLNFEFKKFATDIILSSKYVETEDCNYVAAIINMLNVEKFTIRGFAGQLMELMNKAGMDVEESFTDVGEDGVSVSKTVVDTSNDTTMDDLPEYSDVALGGDDDDDLDDMYDEEPAEANTIFKDLDLDADDSVSVEPVAEEPVPTTAEEAINMVNMDVFDDSGLEELEIEELPEEAEEPEEVAEEAEAEAPAEEAPAEEAKEAEAEAPAEEPKKDDIPDEMKDVIEAVKMAAKLAPAGFHEGEQAADGVVQIIKADGTADASAKQVETIDVSKLVSKPPVKKNIRVNRAKIIQTNAPEEEEVVENPTETIKGTGDAPAEASAEPETITTPVEEKPTDTKTVDIGSGVNIVKEEAPEKPAAKDAMINAMPYIVRVNTGERVMINKAVFKLGKGNRGVDYHISGNGAVSKVHAIIYRRDVGCYLKDNKATNATIVDGKTLGETDEVKLKHDSTITIGGEDFLFKLS